MNLDPLSIPQEPPVLILRTRDAWALAGFIFASLVLPTASASLFITGTMAEMKTEMRAMRSDINRLSDKTETTNARVSHVHAEMAELRGELRGRTAALTPEAKRPAVLSR